MEVKETDGKNQRVASIDADINIDLLGCTYDSLEIEDWRKLMELVEFNPRPWSHLEKVLRATGDKAKADDVYYDRRERESGLIHFWESPGRWLLDFIEKNIAGYGVKNRLVLEWIMLILIAFTLVFQQPGAVVQKRTNNKPGSESVNIVSSLHQDLATTETPPVQLRWDEAFAFSLKTFLPIDIPIAREWQPRPGPYSAWATGLVFLGWILIHVALATFTGWMRRAHPD